MAEFHYGYLPNSDEVASEVLDGEAIIINLSNGMYYSIDGVGGRIWELVERGSTLDAIASDITAHYEIGEATVVEDLRTFLNQLIEEKLIIPADNPSNESYDVPERSRLPYESPELNVYRDMGDLLALDPPLPGLKDIPSKDSEEV